MGSNFARPYAAAAAAALIAIVVPHGAQAAGLGSNLVVNGDAESGLAGWSAFDGVGQFSSDDYGSNWVLPTEPGPLDRGSKLFVGGSGLAYAAGYQMADLSSFSAGTLAQGGYRYTLSGWLGGWTTQNDAATFTVQFVGAGGSVVGTAVLGPALPADRNNTTGLFLFTSSGVVPQGTSAIRFVLEMTRTNGGDNDGYADNLSFTLAAVPEPGSAALLLAGIAGLGLRAARRPAACRAA